MLQKLAKLLGRFVLIIYSSLNSLKVNNQGYTKLMYKSKLGHCRCMIVSFNSFFFQSSIRHTLSQGQYFRKAEKPGMKGKRGFLYEIIPEKRAALERELQKYTGIMEEDRKIATSQKPASRKRTLVIWLLCCYCITACGYFLISGLLESC